MTKLFIIASLALATPALASPSSVECDSWGTCSGSGYDFNVGSYTFETNGYGRTTIRTWDNTYDCSGSGAFATCEARW